MNEFSPLIAAGIGAFVAFLGWPIAHWLTRKRETLAEKRKVRVTYLLEAYRRLEDAGNRAKFPTIEHRRNIESAIADIQLLGTPSQISLAADFADKIAKEGATSLDPNLFDLRNTLRSELELETTDAPLKVLRFN